MSSHAFTVGVEEEYQLVDRSTLRLATGVDDVFPLADEGTAGDEVAHELKRTMIEIGTPVCGSLTEVRASLVRLRSDVAAAAAERGLAIVAAGTHPLTVTVDDDVTDEPDYRAIVDRYAHLARELTVFGCHVHVGVTDREKVIAALNFVRPWLPTLLALSTSSPFWGGDDTGYASYRTEIFGRLPTAGPPEPFSSRADYDDVVDQLLASGAIDDPARIYWDARPSRRYETVEVRVADVCTSIDDAVLIAGLVGGLIRSGVAAAQARGNVAQVRPELLRAARWQAARFGLTSDLIDVFERRARPAREVVHALLTAASPGLEVWGERDTVEALLSQMHARGTSAERQRAAYAERQSIDDVIVWLIDETTRGLDTGSSHREATRPR